MTFMTQKWKLQLYFGTFTLNLDLYWKRWKLCERKDKVWSEPVPKGCAEKKQKCQMRLLFCLFVFVGFFLEKLLYGESLMLSLCRVKKITAEVMFALHINKSCEVESCYLVQECFDRLSDRRWTCTPICFHMWQLTETLRKQPKLEWNATDHHLE